MMLGGHGDALTQLRLQGCRLACGCLVPGGSRWACGCLQPAKTVTLNEAEIFILSAQGKQNKRSVGLRNFSLRLSQIFTHGIWLVWTVRSQRSMLRLNKDFKRIRKIVDLKKCDLTTTISDIYNISNALYLCVPWFFKMCSLYKNVQ